MKYFFLLENIPVNIFDAVIVQRINIPFVAIVNCKKETSMNFKLMNGRSIMI